MKSTGEQRDKRTITLIDDSGIDIQATIWGEQASRSDIEVGSIIAIRGAKVSDYGGKSLNISDQIVVNPVQEQRYRDLTKWYNSGGKEVQTQHLTQLGENGINQESFPLVTF